MMYYLNKKIILILLIALLSAGPLFAQDMTGEEEDENYVEMYGLGDQMFCINAGMFFPLFFIPSCS